LFSRKKRYAVLAARRMGRTALRCFTPLYFNSLLLHALGFSPSLLLSSTFRVVFRLLSRNRDGRNRRRDAIGLGFEPGTKPEEK
jgi:hypothetical protein